MPVPAPLPVAPDDAQRDVVPLDVVYAEVSPCSVGGTSLFATLANDAVTPRTVAAFYSEPHHCRDAVVYLKSLGFTVHHPDVSSVTLAISGPSELYRGVFGVDFRQVSADVPAGGLLMQEYLEPVGQHPDFYAAPPKALAHAIEGVVFPQPHEFHAISATPPPVGYYHLAVPDDIARLLHAAEVHQLGLTGRGINVAMVDSGHYRHPFFIERGYAIAPVLLAADASTSDATRDDSGHGTTESANLFAAAPGVTLIPVKSLLRDTAAAFNVALARNPHIITCSWGRCMRQNLTLCTGAPLGTLPMSERPLQAAIAEAIRRGIVVVFSAGNGHLSWPAMHPDVIAVGGVYIDQNGGLQASSYASSFVSPIFPERRVPDVAGLVGQLPRGTYLMLPCQPGCDVDAQAADRGPFPDGDETAPDDGWAVISGTSAAAPQIAGLVALLLQAAPGLAPATVKALLARAGRDVTTGESNPACEDAPPGPHLAGPGPDLATGGGLADAARLVTMGRLQAYVAGSPAPASAPGGGVPAAASPVVTAGQAAPALGPPATAQAEITIPAGPASEVRLRLSVRVEVTGVEVLPSGPPAPAATAETASGGAGMNPPPALSMSGPHAPTTAEVF